MDQPFTSDKQFLKSHMTRLKCDSITVDGAEGGWGGNRWEESRSVRPASKDKDRINSSLSVK